ncbi:MAG: hypothetical protein IE889_07860 [Campylobacterales bacterium]|nr:hypothetical protein [Campylobacterales bacterium]
MKKSLILFGISSLLTLSHTQELNLFQSVSRSELIDHIIETTDDNRSTIGHNISSSSSEVSIDMPPDISSGNAKRGLKIFTHKLQKHCDVSAVTFAANHTQDEWEAIVETGELYQEILDLCLEIEPVFDHSWLPDLYQFFYEYASDTGNIPSCNN